ncbi:MAG: glycosyltransferase family 2 protein [Verrucomicrobiota bacterium]
MANPSVTILLPAYNEEKSLEIVVGGVRDALADFARDYEILVVDDGSSDRTAAVAAASGARVVTHPRRRGAGAAIKTGLLEACADTVLLMDSDASYPPAAIPGLLAVLDEARQVVGARKTEAGTSPILRAAVKRALRLLGEFLIRQPIPDLNSGMRAFRRRDALAFLHLLPDGHSCVSTLTLSFLGMGLPVRFEPIEYFARVGKSKFRIVSDTLRFLVQIVRTVTYFAPLRVFLTASAGFFLAGMIKSAADVFRKGGLEESDIILFTFAAATGMMGLLADLMVRQSKKDILRELFPESVRGRVTPDEPPG